MVGFPNAGKSTLVNRLAGGREAVTDAEPGVTRDRRALECEWNGLALRPDRHRRRRSRRRRRASAGGPGAGAGGDRGGRRVLLVVDARAGLGPGRRRARRTCCGARAKPVIVAANKIDRREDETLAAELNSLGLGEPLPVSASHGLGTGDLLDRIVEELRAAGVGEEASEAGTAAPDRDPRTAERRQVLAAQRPARLRAGDRLRAGGHHPRPGRHRGRDRRPADGPGRHRGAAPPEQGRGDRRLLRPAALRARRRARRCGDRRLRRLRGAHLRGPPGGRAGDAVGLRHRARAQQVGHLQDRPRRRPRPGRAQAPPAAAAAHLLGADRARGGGGAAPGDRARRARRPSGFPTAGAQPLRRRIGRRAAAAAAAGPAPAALLRGPGGPPAAALRDPGQRPQADRPRLGLPPREPAPRGLRAAGRAPGDRLRPRTGTQAARGGAARV